MKEIYLYEVSYPGTLLPAVNVEAIGMPEAIHMALHQHVSKRRPIPGQATGKAKVLGLVRYDSNGRREFIPEKEPALKLTPQKQASPLGPTPPSATPAPAVPVPAAKPLDDYQFSTEQEGKKHDTKKKGQS